jgi:hypothetical protein
MRGIGCKAASVNDICIELVMILTRYFIIYQQTLLRNSTFVNYIAGFSHVLYRFGVI